MLPLQAVMRRTRLHPGKFLERKWNLEEVGKSVFSTPPGTVKNQPRRSGADSSLMKKAQSWAYRPAPPVELPAPLGLFIEPPPPLELLLGLLAPAAPGMADG